MEHTRKLRSSIFCTKSDDSGKGSSSFIKYGSRLLKELIITQCGGRSKIPLRNYSSEELVQATHNFSFHCLVTEDCHYKIYKGSFDNHKILVKKYNCYGSWVPHIELFVGCDIVISSQMSFHKNVLKVIGYCLDRENMALVFQSPETYDCLAHHLLNTKLTWERKLSLASDIAYILVYLHTGFQTPVIHRNLKLDHFVIDKYGTAKFVDFSFCISIPLGESQVQDNVIGTNGYLDPAYFSMGILTEKTDVYNFGLVLIELLTRKKFPKELMYEYQRITQDEVQRIVNGDVVMEGEMGRNEEVRAIAALALKCARDERESRPEMVDVAKELRRMLKSASSSSTS